MYEKNRSRLWFWIASTAYLIIIGTLFHFLNDWTGNSPFTVWFAPINESIWEHLKLLFFPGLVLVAVGIWREKGDLTAQICGIFVGMLWITAAYYTLYGITGRNWDWVNILIFVIGCCISQAIAVSRRKIFSLPIVGWVSIAMLFLFFFLFIRFTYAPPQLPFFLDPQTGAFGIRK